MVGKVFVGLFFGLLIFSSFVAAVSFDMTSDYNEEVEIVEEEPYLVGLNVGNKYLVIDIEFDGFKIFYDKEMSVHHTVDMSVVDFVDFTYSYFMGGEMERVGLLSTTFSVPVGKFINMKGLGVEK